MKKFKIFINFFFIDLKRNLLGKKMIFSVLGIAVICFVFSVQYFIDFPAVYVYGCCFFASSFLLPAVFFLAAIPGSLGFCQDVENNFLIYGIIRGDYELYGWSKILANITTSFAVSLCGNYILLCNRNIFT